MEARGLPVHLEKVTNYALIVAAGVLATPGIALDDRLVSSGKVPSAAEVESWLA
jgi:hypothetical protein